MERKEGKIDMAAEEFVIKTKGAICGICGKELFDEKNMEEHYKEDHPNLV